MRDNRWKRILVVGIAFIIGAIFGILTAIFLPTEYDMFRGTATFSVIIIVSILIVLLAVKVFHVGDDY